MLARILVPAAMAVASLPLLHLAAFHAWAAAGPPTQHPEWHLQWAKIFFTCWASAVLLAILANLLLRAPEDRVG